MVSELRDEESLTWPHSRRDAVLHHGISVSPPAKGAMLPAFGVCLLKSRRYMASGRGSSRMDPPDECRYLSAYLYRWLYPVDGERRTADASDASPARAGGGTTGLVPV